MHRDKSTFFNSTPLVKSKKSTFSRPNYQCGISKPFSALAVVWLGKLKTCAINRSVTTKLTNNCQVKNQATITHRLTPVPLDVRGSKHRKSTLKLKRKQKKSATSSHFNLHSHLGLFPPRQNKMFGQTRHNTSSDCG